ncbi:MAG: FkbM family methyltransferase [Pseudomonadota bacterium]
MSKTAGPVPGERATASVDARISKELATMGLLLLATEVVSEDLDATIATPGAYGNRHRIAVLKSELIQIRQQLALHQSRRQMGGGSRDESLSDPQLALRNSMSQLGQDIWVLEQSMYKRRGYFVEFGATDGILLSNTFMLEKQFAWTGLLAEPNPGYFRELQRNRSSLAVDACIAAKTGDIVDFVLADEFGGMKDYISRDRHAARRESYASVPEGILTLSTISLDDFLRTNGAPKKIDYVSVDTEGSELDILSAFPFEKWDVRLWTIEHNFTPDRKEIFELMSSHGYLRKEVQFDDWYYKAEP